MKKEDIDELEFYKDELRGVGRFIDSVYWIPISLIGLSWISFSYIGARARQKKWIITALAYLVIEILSAVLLSESPEESGIESFFGTILFLSIFVSFIHCMWVRAEYLRVMDMKRLEKIKSKKEMQLYREKRSAKASKEDNPIPRDFEFAVSHKTKNNAYKILNINKVSVAELATISTVSVTDAKKILTYRDVNGKFESVDEFYYLTNLNEVDFKNLKIKVVCDDDSVEDLDDRLENMKNQRAIYVDEEFDNAISKKEDEIYDYSKNLIFKNIIEYTALDKFDNEKEDYMRSYDYDHSSEVELFTSVDRDRKFTYYSTIGLSKFMTGRKLVDNRYLNIELICAEAFETSVMKEVIIACASKVANGDVECSYGKVIPNIVEKYYPNTKFKHILFTNPYLWKIEDVEFKEMRVTWLMLMPISDEEYDYLNKNGHDKLEEIFSEKSADACDLFRENSITKESLGVVQSEIKTENSSEKIQEKKIVEIDPEIEKNKKIKEAKLKEILKTKFNENMTWVNNFNISTDIIERQFSEHGNMSTISLGSLLITSGKIAIGDTLAYIGQKECAFLVDQTIGMGYYPLDLSIVDTGYFGKRICTIRLKISDVKVVKYELIKHGKNMFDYNPFGLDLPGIPIESGLISITDKDTVKDYVDFSDLWKKENPGKNIYYDYFERFFKENDSLVSYINWANPLNGKNMPIIHSGFGDGLYQAYYGYGEEHNIAEIIIPMINQDIFTNIEV